MFHVPFTDDQKENFACVLESPNCSIVCMVILSGAVFVISVNRYTCTQSMRHCLGGRLSFKE